MGYYLDQWLDTRPMFTLIMLVFGVISGFRNVYILTNRELRRQEMEEKKQSGVTDDNE